MILDNSIKLEAVLAGAVTANQPEYHVAYSVWNVEGVKTRPEPARGALNSSTDVTLLAAATTQNERREVEGVAIYNKDTASATVTVKTDDGTTERIICKVQLATTETLFLDREWNWKVLQANGATKLGSGVTGPGSSTDNAVARYDGTGGALLQNSAFIVDDTGHVTSFGGQIAFPASQAASAGGNVLDDYEEGTFTPVIAGDSTAGTQTYDSQTGRYTKKGRDVSVEFRAVMTAKDGATAGNIFVGGLPFTPGLQIGAMALGRWGAVNLSAGYTQLTLPILGGVVFLQEGGDNVMSQFIAAANIGNTTEIEGAGVYSV